MHGQKKIANGVGSFQSVMMKFMISKRSRRLSISGDTVENIYSDLQLEDTFGITLLDIL